MTAFRVKIDDPGPHAPHVGVRIFAGPISQGAYCGALTMRREEAEEFKVLVAQGQEALRLLVQSIPITDSYYGADLKIADLDPWCQRRDAVLLAT